MFANHQSTICKCTVCCIYSNKIVVESATAMLDKFDNDPRPRLTVRNLIPASRLASIGDFDASEPAVCDGDDVYELNLTGDNLSYDDLDIEYAFLRCIVDAE